jgi:hypothetical protein
MIYLAEMLLPGVGDAVTIEIITGPASSHVS